MQQEDDLRGLARVMDFMRAVSILFVGINVYWFCYSTLKEWGVTFEVIDKILWKFQRTTGLFSSILWTKLFSVMFLALSCIGTKGVKEENREKVLWGRVSDEKIKKMIVEMGGAFFEKNAAAMEQRLKECALDIHKQIDFYRKDYVEKMKVICPVGILGGIMISIMLI